MRIALRRVWQFVRSLAVRICAYAVPTGPGSLLRGHGSKLAQRRGDIPGTPMVVAKPIVAVSLCVISLAHGSRHVSRVAARPRRSNGLLGGKFRLTITNSASSAWRLGASSASRSINARLSAAHTMAVSSRLSAG